VDALVSGVVVDALVSGVVVDAVGPVASTTVVVVAPIVPVTAPPTVPVVVVAPGGSCAHAGAAARAHTAIASSAPSKCVART
jgi:hypothetical protein